MIVLFVDNLFFYLGGQSVSCKASLAALQLYGYFCDIVVMMLLSENKYDDEESSTDTAVQNVSLGLSIRDYSWPLGVLLIGLRS